MPVTTRGAPVEVKIAPQLSPLNSTSIFQATCSSLWRDGNSILDSSFGANTTIQTASNGFVTTVLDAYLQHNHLVLRPEDVWFAILIQFSFYVNANAEKLRKYFVDHVGKKKLVIFQDLIDFPAFVVEMTDLIAKNVKDPALKNWIMPSFTTTTDSDKVTAAIIMMGTMQKYFAYFLGITCGIPSVTLMGEKKDWEDIFDRIQYLNTFGEEHEELVLWNSVLTSIISKFVQTFDAPDTPDVVKFWQRAVHQSTDSYSGEKQITGWITAFCFWDADGKPLVARNVQYVAPQWKKAVKALGPDYWLEEPRLGILEWNDIPAGYAHVPIHIKYYTNPREKFVTKAVAGSIGWKVLDSESIFLETRGKKVTDKSTRKPNLPLGSFGKMKPSEPSTFTGNTLIENPPVQKLGLLRELAQKILCFRTDTGSNEGSTDPKKVKVMDEDLSLKAQDGDFDQGVNSWQMSEARRYAPQISDLGELSKPWEYEKGGKSDTIQPVTGWWIMKDIEGKYGKDPDVPDVEFDSDEEGYDDDLARNGKPLKDEL